MKDNKTWSKDKADSIFAHLCDPFKKDQELKESLKNAILVAVQHRLLTTSWLMEAAVEMGVNSDNIFYLDKMYSWSKAGEEAFVEFKEKLQQDGKPFIRDYKNKRNFDLGEDFEELYTNDVREMLKNVVNHIKNKPQDQDNQKELLFLVLDDLVISGFGLMLKTVHIRFQL